MKNGTRAKEIVQAVQKKRHLPALDENVSDVCRLTEDMTSSPQELSAVIMRDCGLTLSLLSTANSVFYCPRSSVKTVSSAVVLLGFKKIRNLALGLSIFQRTMRSLRNRELSRLYASSYFSALLTRELARMAGVEKDTSAKPEQMFIAGLLHQFPFVALANAFPERYLAMEEYIRNEDVLPKHACRKIFGLNYDDISEAFAGMYNLPDSIKALSSQDTSWKNGTEAAIVQESHHLSNLLFGMEKNDKRNFPLLQSRLQNLLNDPGFNLSEFISRTCTHDKNIKRFFNLDRDDVEMMVKILQWGKGSPAQLTEKLTFGGTENENTSDEPPEKLIGHFFTEMLLRLRQGQSLNNLIILAQEALYRSLRPAHVSAFFKKPEQYILQGRYYTGDGENIQPRQWQIPLNDTSNLLVDAMHRNESGEWADTETESVLHMPEEFMESLNLRHAIFAPVAAESRVVGLVLVGRSERTPFAPHEKLWLEQITQYVGMAFTRTKTTRGVQATATV